MATPHEIDRGEGTSLKDIELEAIYKTYEEAQVETAKKIKSHLGEISKVLTDKSPVAVLETSDRLGQWRAVYDPQTGSLAREIWETHRFAEDNEPTYDLDILGSGLPVVPIRPYLRARHDAEPDDSAGYWIKFGRELAGKIHARSKTKS